MAFLSLILHNDTIYTCTFDVIIFSHKTTFLVKIFMMMIIMTMMGMYRNYRACTPTLLQEQPTNRRHHPDHLPSLFTMITILKERKTQEKTI